MECRDREGVWRTVVVRQTSVAVDTFENNIGDQILAAEVIRVEIPDGDTVYRSKLERKTVDYIVLSLARGELNFYSIRSLGVISQALSIDISNGMHRGEDARMLGTILAFDNQNLADNRACTLLVGSHYERLRVYSLELSIESHELQVKKSYNAVVEQCVLFHACFRKELPQLAKRDAKVARKNDNLGFYICFAGNGKTFLRLYRWMGEQEFATLMFQQDWDVPLGILAVEEGVLIFTQKQILFIHDKLFENEKCMQDPGSYTYSCDVPGICVSWCEDEREEVYIGTEEGEIFHLRFDRLQEKLILDKLVSLGHDIGTCLSVHNRPNGTLILKYGGDRSQGKIYRVEQLSHSATNFEATEVASYPNWAPFTDAVVVSEGELNTSTYAVGGQGEQGQVMCLQRGLRASFDSQMDLGVQGGSEIKYVPIDESSGFLFASTPWACEVFNIDWKLEYDDANDCIRPDAEKRERDKQRQAKNLVRHSNENTTNNNVRESDENDESDDNNDNNNDNDRMSVDTFSNDEEEEDEEDDDDDGNVDDNTEYQLLTRKLHRVTQFTREDMQLEGDMLAAGRGSKHLYYVSPVAAYSIDLSDPELAVVSHVFNERVSLAHLHENTAAFVCNTAGDAVVRIVDMISGDTEERQIGSEVSAIRLQVVNGHMLCLIGSHDSQIMWMEVGYMDSHIKSGPIVKVIDLSNFASDKRAVPSDFLLFSESQSECRLIAVCQAGLSISCTLKLDVKEPSTPSNFETRDTKLIGCKLEDVRGDEPGRVLVRHDGDGTYLVSQFMSSAGWELIVPDRCNESALFCFAGENEFSNFHQLFALCGSTLYLARVARTPSLVTIQVAATFDSLLSGPRSPRRIIYLKNADALCVLFRDRSLPLFLDRKKLNVLNFEGQAMEAIELFGTQHCIVSCIQGEGDALILGGERGVLRIDVHRPIHRRREISCNVIWNVPTRGPVRVLTIDRDQIYFFCDDGLVSPAPIICKRALAKLPKDVHKSIELRSAVVHMSVLRDMVFASTMRSSIFLLMDKPQENGEPKLEACLADSVNRPSVTHIVLEIDSRIEILVSDRAGQVAWLRKVNSRSSSFKTIQVWTIQAIVVRFLPTELENAVDGYTLGGAVHRFILENK